MESDYEDGNFPTDRDNSDEIDFVDVGVGEDDGDGEGEGNGGSVDEIVPIENVTVKFRISDNQIVAQVYPNRLKIADIKKDIARKFEIEPEDLRLKQCSQLISDQCLLLETDKDEFGIHEFTLELVIANSSTMSVVPKLDLDVYYNKYRLPDFITVHIAAEDNKDCVSKDIVVEIQNKAIIKPILCIFRNKNTGIEYHDAFSQTGPDFDKWKYRRYISRQTQTWIHRNNEMNTMHDQMSQCFRDGNNVLYVAEAKDIEIIPRKYQSYAQKARAENKLGKIQLIQRNWRRYLLTRLIKKAAREYRELEANRLAAEEEFKKQIERRITRAQRAKQFPRTKYDFDLLYSEVRKWKMAEMKRITDMYEGASRIAEINMLLDKEIQMLNGIERQRVIVYKSMQDFRDQQILKTLGEPIKWIGYKDNTIHLDLLRTQRARFLHEVYNDLQKPTKIEERLDLIAKVKEILVKEQEFPEFPELFDLFEREKNLLIYTKFCDVEILRKRQNLLFLELIKFSKDAVPPKIVKRMCEVCKEVKTYDKFAVRTRQNIVNTCKKCYYLKFSSTENGTYTAILRSIQRDERKRRCSGSYAFVLQIDDVRFIIDQIWHKHSIISKDRELSNLRLPRWNKGEDWSPWNCICLTEVEAHDHYYIKNLENVYNKRLIQEVRNRHLLARSAFHNLAAVATEFTESGQWWSVGMNKQRTVDIPAIIPLRRPIPQGRTQKDVECQPP